MRRTIQSIRSSLKQGLRQIRSEIRPALTRTFRSKWKPEKGPNWDLRRGYYITSEKGVFRLDRSGFHRIHKIPTYGMALFGDWVFFSFIARFDGDHSLVVRGDREALTESGRKFHFQEVYRIRCQTTHERIHQVSRGTDCIWVANTGRNTLLRIDPESCAVLSEIPLFTDRFGHRVLHDQNHVNSVAQYGDNVLFTAYRAGERSLIGVMDDTSIIGYAYPHVGIHDICLGDGNFLFCDTFGKPGSETGGVPVTRDGPLDPDFFAKPPGYVVRGVAGCEDEMLIGHSHKGTRAKRFKGHGSLLLVRKGKVAAVSAVKPAQVYQIITENGDFLERPQKPVKPEDLHSMLTHVLGDPVYHARVAPLPEPGGK